MKVGNESQKSSKIERKRAQNRRFWAQSGGDGEIRTHVPVRANAFRVFYSEHSLADFEKKCPILRVNALVRRKWLPSPFWLLPTVRNARELSERTNRTAIKHNNRKSPLNQWFSELRQPIRSFDFECVM